MKAENNRAFKEWAVSCAAMREGRQSLLIRKGGIREEGGTFTIHDPEFFLLPTYEHQNPELLQTEFVSRLEAPQNLNTITLSEYAVVETIWQAQDEEQVNALADEHIWNPAFVKMRFDFNPYDPLYLILLRVYRLPEPITLPMRPAYGGCKSWITLERPLSTVGAIPALSDEEFAARHSHLKARMT